MIFGMKRNMFSFGSEIVGGLTEPFIVPFPFAMAKVSTSEAS
jgi:hypothetical protein